MNKKYHVRYKVPALTGDEWHVQGPWDEEQAMEELHDIRGYEGVANAHLTPYIDATEVKPEAVVDLA